MQVPELEKIIIKIVRRHHQQLVPVHLFQAVNLFPISLQTKVSLSLASLLNNCNQQCDNRSILVSTSFLIMILKNMQHRVSSMIIELGHEWMNFKTLSEAVILGF